MAEDNLLVREGICALVRSRGHQVVDGVDRAERVPALARSSAPDLLILDIRMPPTFTDEGLQLAAGIRRAQPGVGVLVLSQYVVAEYAAWLLEQSPVSVGYLLKDSILRTDVLEDAMVRVAAGGTVIDPAVAQHLVQAAGPTLGLTERETDVLRLMAEGLSDQGIADRLTVSVSTVGTHVQHIFGKLNLPCGPADNRRVQAVVAYLASPRPWRERAR